MDSEHKADVWRFGLLMAALTAAYVAHLIWK